MSGGSARWGWTLLKLMVAVGVVWFLLSQGKLDLTLFINGAISFEIIVVALVCNFITFFFSALRWHVLLRSQKVVLPFSWVHSMTYLCVCFNMLVPGAVGGDAMRMGYAAQAVPDRKGATILTVFADRFVGLYALLVLSLLGILIAFSTVMAVTPLKFMFFVITVIVVGGPLLLVVLLILLPRIPWLRNYIDTPRPGRIWHLFNTVIDSVRHFVRAKGQLFLALLLSVLAQGFQVVSLIWIAMSLDMMTIPVQSFFVAAPLAWVANILPISPGGLGVGEAAFDQMCHWLQPVQTATAFGTVFFINRIFQMTASLPGFYVYIFYKKKQPSTSTTYTKT
ncbi:MAG: flippase-like domain-containing protein [Magnetococcales bacterium]|nr:flippase-like domain-containing protein [Magnetococcales bacterium]